MQSRTFLAKIILIMMIGIFPLSAEPEPGDIFREYIRHWADEGDRLRVGGKLDYGGTEIQLPGEIDLTNAVKAEVEIQKLLCHAYTSGLSISVNGHGWHLVPESPFIPEPQAVYQHQFNPVVEIPLSELENGGNTFKLKVDEDSTWWAQNLIYGVTFRIYYNDSVPRPGGRITEPVSGSTVGRVFSVKAEVSGGIDRVEFVAFYRGFDWDGDGEFREWHGHLFHDTLLHHMGTDTEVPYQVQFDTSWVPDQAEPIKISARVVGKDGMIYMLPAARDIILERPGYSVKMYEPYDIPEQWVTRKWEMEEKVDITGDLSKAAAAKLMWVSWAGGYAHGIFVNQHKVIDRAVNTLYRCDWNIVDVPLEYLKEGTNVIMTGWTEGGGKHGMEVQWPGITVLVQYTEK